MTWVGLSEPGNENVFQPERYPCTSIYRCVVTIDSRVLTCCLAPLIMPQELIIADANEQDLEDIMENDRIRHLKMLNVNERLETTYPCRNRNRWTDRPNLLARNRIPLLKRKWL